MTALRRIADDNKPLLMRGSSLDTVINALAIGVIAAIGITLLGVTTALTAFPPTTLLGVAAGIVILSVAKHCLFNSQNAKWYKELNGTDAKAAPEPVRKAVQEAFNNQHIPGTLPTGLFLTGLINLTANNEPAATALIEALSTVHIQALSAVHIQALSTVHIQALSTEQIEALSTEQIEALSAVHIQALSAVHIQALSAVHIQALSPLHIQHLSADQIQALSETQLKAIKLETLQAISDSIGTQALPDNNMSALFISLQALHHKQFVPTEAPLKFDLEHPSVGFLKILGQRSPDTAAEAFSKEAQVNTFLSTFRPGQVYTINGTFIDNKTYTKDKVHAQLQKDLIDRGGGDTGQLTYYLDGECVSRDQKNRGVINKEETEPAFIPSLQDKLKPIFAAQETQTLPIETQTLPIMLLLSQATEGTLLTILTKTCVFPDCILVDYNNPALKSKTEISVANKTFTCTLTTPMRVNGLSSANTFIFTLKIEHLDKQNMMKPNYTLTIESTKPITTTSE
ncbi:MAG: hypothetical protein NTZ52_01215 [Chlamydiae bacterium]|nr:hypothetical protein [Chlamydiota bacterium]